MPTLEFAPSLPSVQLAKRKIIHVPGVKKKTTTNRDKHTMEDLHSQMDIPHLIRTNGIGDVVVVVRPCPWWAMMAAVLVVAYFLSFVSYMVISKVALKTPFSDSLTAKQRALKSASARQRHMVFWVSFGVALLVSGGVGYALYLKR